FEIFPFIAAILIATTLFSASGLSGALTKLVSPVFNFLGVPSEVCELIMIKPFSGSGSTAVLANILKTYGADSYIARCACVIASSSETIFYMSAVYFSSVKIKKLGYAIPLSIFASLIGAVVGCLICRIC
ncbi:MAG: spore maturation protein, partial [Clostridia bacterium]